MPTTARSVSASRASGASAGWQHAKSSASRSSVAGTSSYVAASAGGSARAARERRLARAAADQVQGVVPRGRLQPGGRVVRRAVAAPRLERLGDRGLHGLLGEVEVVELAGQPGHQQTGLLAQGAREESVGLLGGRHSNWL